MTEIKLSRTNQSTELTVMGHCNAGKINGMDLCCCGVSMLTFTIMETLGAMDLAGYKSSYGGGWCYIFFENSGRDASKADIAVDTVMKGYKLLENSYPSNVTIISDKKEDSI